MREILMEKCKALAEEMNWTLERAEGYVDGEIFGRQGLEISGYYKLGTDEYAAGFRTGYYKQACSVTITTDTRQ